ncbi:hypothetical protein BKA63DRAFT_580729 [Paraphoma chrysanthemicola]|nr:hypothetical protein BKA63DRAFT_580729 [Paraphoma chrysanthemicola]
MAALDREHLEIEPIDELRRFVRFLGTPVSSNKFERAELIDIALEVGFTRQQVKDFDALRAKELNNRGRQARLFGQNNDTISGNSSISDGYGASIESDTEKHGAGDTEGEGEVEETPDDGNAATSVAASHEDAQATTSQALFPATASITQNRPISRAAPLILRPLPESLKTRILDANQAWRHANATGLAEWADPAEEYLNALETEAKAINQSEFSAWKWDEENGYGNM